MKNLKINVNHHQAILSFKKISHKKFSTLKWKLIQQNIDEISEQLAKSLEEEGHNTLYPKGEEL
jgi:hypothetical protein